jgi:circadian clock protein KaiB
MAKKKKNMLANFEQTLAGAEAQIYVLRLCISGMTPRSRRALVNLKKLCDEHLTGQYELEVIDLYQQPELAARHQVIATPTLLKTLPPPIRRMFGDLSNTGNLLRCLGVALVKAA